MTESPSSAAEELFAALAELRTATLDVSYTTLVRQAAAQRPPLKISRQRLSDWFLGKAVPDDPAVMRFLVGYLQPRATPTSGYQQRPLDWWLKRYQAANLQRAEMQRKTTRDSGGQRAVRARPRRRLGRSINACDPIGPGGLGVHSAIQVPGPGPADVLPRYMPRSHDGQLREIVDRMLEDGRSQLITLVGGSSTGKTRACWEVARCLESAQQGRWRLWHPYDPTRPEAALADLDRVGPDTLVWLNEAQHYLMPPDPGLGERIAAGLRTLLTDPDRNPVLVLATVWPDYWEILTTRPSAGRPDPYPQARDLLTDTAVIVADAFTRTEIAALDGPGIDARLRHAAEHAEDGRITQYLAGVPELLRRYRTARRAARAIIEVAMDARRLGHPLALSHDLLVQAVPGYLDETTWSTLGGSWPRPLDTALTELGEPAHGILGPISPIHPLPGDTSVPDRPCYRLADHLEQTGRRERAAIYPPDSLWQAFATAVTDPDLLRNLGRQAQQRGRYQHAIWLYTQAADCGDTAALRDLAEMREEAGDTAGAEALLRQAADRGDTAALRDLARRRERAGDTAGAEALYRRAADSGDARALPDLVRLREQAGDTAGAEALAVQAADRGDTAALRDLAEMREEAGDTAGAEALLRQAADRGDTAALRDLARRRERAGDTAGAEALYRRAADSGDTRALPELVRLREQAGDTASVEELCRQAIGCNNSGVLWELAVMREEAGDAILAEELCLKAVDHGRSGALYRLALIRDWAGDHVGAEALFRKAVERGTGDALWELATQREEAGDLAGAEAIAMQAKDSSVLLALAMSRELAGDYALAEELYRRAVDLGSPIAGADTRALGDLAKLRELAGDTVGAQQIRKFGLTGSGQAATGLDFGL